MPITALPAHPLPTSQPFRTQPAVLRTTTPQLSVVIVNYRTWDNTAALVRQLLKTSGPEPQRVEVVIVDNHSPAHPLMHRLRRWPRVSLRRWGRNRGFARAVNEGCRLSRGDWLLLLNPDVSVPAGFVEGALALADRLTEVDPHAGVVGFRLRNSDGSPQLSCGPDPTLFSTLSRLVLPRCRRKYSPALSPSLQQVPWVTGCCLLVRRACWADLSGFDPAFFLYYEDVDFCRRARAAGWSVWHEPGLEVVHHAPLHGRPVPPALRVLTRHALLTFAARHWPAWQFRALGSIVRLEAQARSAWAQWSGNATAAEHFHRLGTLARELTLGRTGPARRRLDEVVRSMEDTACLAACPS
jgi:GT2 family glycosyltransferase